MTIRLGQRRMRIRDLLRLEHNAILELDRRVDDPLELVVNGRVVARGEVLVDGDRLAIRILDVIAAADRLQTLQ
jgi:flagellar motor switch protein FliN/FliY